MGHLGAILCNLKAIVGPACDHLGTILGHVGPSWALLGSSLAHRGPSWAILGQLEPTWPKNPSKRVPAPIQKLLPKFSKKLDFLGSVFGPLFVLLGILIWAPKWLQNLLKTIQEKGSRMGSLSDGVREAISGDAGPPNAVNYNKTFSNPF